ncbi:hypothetical protein E2C01_025089 [Portunus trituberculatus]|uniref:Uncharacterized protein n=1 Tax=Portunus trituberculatus TaxID=210409 RepID=A0A5B7EFM1_PORTR|nr:hypothetical protein [Portunus trituberculatus]
MVVVVVVMVVVVVVVVVAVVVVVVVVVMVVVVVVVVVVAVAMAVVVVVVAAATLMISAAEDGGVLGFTLFTADLTARRRCIPRVDGALKFGDKVIKNVDKEDIDSEILTKASYYLAKFYKTKEFFSPYLIEYC